MNMKRATCNHCLRPKSVCYCHTLVQLSNAWPIHIFQHPTESKHAIGTARIAQLGLERCKLEITDVVNQHACGNECGDLPVLVYPGEDAKPVESLNPEQPRTLIFLDASWRKSRRMLYESPYLMALPKVSFQLESSPRYKIRKAPDPESFSTLEAIVQVLSVIEKNDQKFQPLLNTMDWMIQKQIELMGLEVYEKNYHN